MFFPLPLISLRLTKAIGKVTGTDGIRAVPFKIPRLQRKDGDERVPHHDPAMQALAQAFQLCCIWSCTCSLAVIQLWQASINQTNNVKFSTFTVTD